MFNLMILEDNERIPRRGGSKSKSIVANLVDVQIRLREELDKMAVVLE